jgi:toxic protein SymE
MQITERLLAHAGFLPGQHVLFSVDYRNSRITITPDHSYMIAGVPVIN